MNRLTVGRVAEAAGVSPATIRHYERVGVLPKAVRTPAGYRVYPANAVHRVLLVRGALQFGFSLRQLAAFLRVRDSGGSPCRQVRAAGQQILEAADQQLQELRKARRMIAQTLRHWDVSLDAAGPDRPARLLEALSVWEPARTARPAALRRRG